MKEWFTLIDYAIILLRNTQTHTNSIPTFVCIYIHTHTHVYIYKGSKRRKLAMAFKEYLQTRPDCDTRAAKLALRISNS